jgi:excisionase family DNA binding protein
MQPLQAEYAQWRKAERERVAELSRWLTLPQVSELTAIPTRTLRAYIESGKLRAFHPVNGNSIRVRASDVDSLFTEIVPKDVAGRIEQ